MKLLYALRVFFIGYEFLLVIVSFAVYIFYGNSLEQHYLAISINQEALKWSMLFPVGIAGWTLKEGVGVLFPDDKTSAILHDWPDYWKLKIHFNVGIFNCILYLLPCIAVWLIGGFKTFLGAWLFFSLAIVISINAFTFYTAKIAIRSALLKVSLLK